MEFKLHTNFPPELATAWDELLQQSITNVPFLLYEHLEIWWKTRGGGEWGAEDRLAIVSAWEGKELIGLAPWFIHSEQGKRILMLLGSKEICDYLDVIVKPENLRPFVGQLTIFITSPDFPGWDQIVFHNLIESSPTIDILKEAAESRGWQFSRERSKQSPIIQLPGDWNAYLLSIDKKQRHEIHRKMHRAEENTLLRWYFVEDGNTINAAANDFIGLMAKDPKKSSFLNPLMKEHMQLILNWAFTAGILQLSFLEIQKQKAAGYFCFNYENKILVYNSGYDPDFSEYSPGWVLLGYLLQWANENRFSEFDFMRGNEDYKYRFGARDRFVICATLSRDTT